MKRTKPSIRLLLLVIVIAVVSGIRAFAIDSTQSNQVVMASGLLFNQSATDTPQPLVLTSIAQLSSWEPQIAKDDFQVDMVLVPPGCFTMGTTIDDLVRLKADEGASEKPTNMQCLDKAFYIDRYEVTNAQFDGLKGKANLSSYFCDPNQNGILNGPELKNCLQLPRENITWFEAHDFCKLRNARLPSELEWEYAARGPDSLTYPWGNTFVPENVIYGREHNEGPASVINEDGSPARPNSASWVGALDMVGNTGEWTNTRLGDEDRLGRELNIFLYPYTSNDGREDGETLASYEARWPKVQLFTDRIYRGGSWFDDEGSQRAAFRDRHMAGGYLEWIGFRCARAFNS